MNLQTHPEVFEKHPELASLVDVLLKAGAEYNTFKKNYEKANKDHPDVRKRQYTGRAKCYAKISKYYKNGAWQFPPSNPIVGEEFEVELHRILSLNPDKIIIDIHKGSTANSLKTDTKTFDLTAQAANATEPLEVVHQPQMLGELNNSLLALQQTVEKLKTTNPLDASGNVNAQIAEMQRSFDSQLADIKHQTAIKEKQLEWEKKEDSYKREIQDLKDEVEYLEEEIEEGKQALNGLAEEKEQKHVEDNAMGTVALRFLGKVVNGVLAENPTILKKGLGMTQADIDEWLKNDVNKGEAKIENTENKDESSFKRKDTSASTDQFAGLTKEHKEGLEIVLAFCKQIGSESFAKVYQIFGALQDEKTGMLNEDMAKRLMITSLEETPA